MSTCNQLDLETLGFQPVLPKYLLDIDPINDQGRGREIQYIHLYERTSHPLHT
jgi:hypothetical protein